VTLRRRLAIIGIAGLLSIATACQRAHKPKALVPVIFLNCDIFVQPNGKNGCECLHPLKVEKVDARTGKRMIYAYCDGKVN
jgi:hypothetical protein